MIDAQKLLDQFLGAGAGAQASGALGDLQNRAGGALGDLQSKAGGVLGEVQRQAAANPLAAKVIAGGLAAILLGSRGRGLTGSAAKLGGLAAIGGLAYKAYQDYQAKKAGTPVQPAGTSELLPPPDGTPFIPTAGDADNRARLLVTAMISAAKADGYIDAAEQKKIQDRVGALNLDPESKAYLMDELRSPLDLDGLVKAAKSPEVATAVYAASLIAIDPDHPAERAYLQMLAARLGLAPGLVEEIHRTAASAQAA